MPVVNYLYTKISSSSFRVTRDGCGTFDFGVQEVDASFGLVELGLHGVLPLQKVLVPIVVLRTLLLQLVQLAPSILRHVAAFSLQLASHTQKQ